MQCDLSTQPNASAVADLVIPAAVSGSSDDEDDAVNPPRGGEGAAVANGGAGEGADVLHEEEMKPRAMLDLPPLFLRLAERPAERLHYVGVSFGLTQPLLRFWQKLKFVPLYLRQTASDITGENTCIMLKALASDQVDGTVRSARCLLSRRRFSSAKRCRADPGRFARDRWHSSAGEVACSDVSAPSTAVPPVAVLFSSDVAMRVYAVMADGAPRRLLLAADSAALGVVPGHAACNGAGAAAA